MSELVLHVVDRTTGGVPIAVRSYIENSPPAFAHAILSPFDNGAGAAVWNGVEQAKLIDMGRPSIAQTPRRIRGVVRELAPSVVHAHSSFSGVFTRLALRRGHPKILYSPHCFSFERTDVGRSSRHAYRLVERLLGRNTDLLVACGKGELELARKMSAYGSRVDWVPNVPSISSDADGIDATPLDHARRIRVGMLGRLSPQKDPTFFAQRVNELAASGGLESATWIGAGDVPESFLTAGVETTGWLDSAGVEANLKKLDLYLHSAAWEGFPIAVLDAFAASRPILVRQIGAFAGIDPGLTIEGGWAALLTSLERGTFSSWRLTNLDMWRSYLADNTAVGQRQSLERVWGTKTLRGVKTHD